MRFKNMLTCRGGIAYCRHSAFSAAKGRWSRRQFFRFLKEESVVSSSESQSAPEKSAASRRRLSKTDGNYTHEYTETVTAPYPASSYGAHTSQNAAAERLYKDNIVAIKQRYLRRLGRMTITG